MGVALGNVALMTKSSSRESPGTDDVGPQATTFSYFQLDKTVVICHKSVAVCIEKY